MKRSSNRKNFNITFHRKVLLEERKTNEKCRLSRFCLLLSSFCKRLWEILRGNAQNSVCFVLSSVSRLTYKHDWAIVTCAWTWPISLCQYEQKGRKWTYALLARDSSIMRFLKYLINIIFCTTGMMMCNPSCKKSHVSALAVSSR